MREALALAAAGMAARGVLKVSGWPMSTAFSIGAMLVLARWLQHESRSATKLSGDSKSGMGVRLAKQAQALRQQQADLVIMTCETR